MPGLFGRWPIKACFLGRRTIRHPTREQSVIDGRRDKKRYRVGHIEELRHLYGLRVQGHRQNHPCARTRRQRMQGYHATTNRLLRLAIVPTSPDEPNTA